MRIRRIAISNYRLLKELHLDLEDDLSLVIGKNNTGKTSLLSLMERFLSERGIAKKFQCEDFNLDFQKSLKQAVEAKVMPTWFTGICMKLFIEYSPKDNLANIGWLISNLDPANNTVLLSYEYSISETDFYAMVSKFDAYYAEHASKLNDLIAKEEDETEKERLEEKKTRLFYDFLRKEQSDFFSIKKKVVGYDSLDDTEIPEETRDITTEAIHLDKLICFKVIGAKRDVSNKDTDRALSILSSKYYEKRGALEEDKEAIKKFKDTLTATDIQLDKAYHDLFTKVIDKVERFGGVKAGDSAIKVISTLQERELLKGNTTVMYDHDEHSLPEHYNGLGYMNLLGMIFEIEVILNDFRKESKKDERPADINLLFIEEPEAHTHPQMQYAFIKNIKSVLQEAKDGENGTKTPFALQTIISTHSSHITAESRFEDIKYFKRKDVMTVEAKNLRNLQKDYGGSHEKSYKFLKQYLTLNRAELFFADKAILIEGDTERILLPAMMKKIDQDAGDGHPRLLSQNISIVEVGAYSQIFERFLEFIGIKTLIISDLDAAKPNGKVPPKNEACLVAEGTTTTNASLKYFHNKEEDLAYYLGLTFDQKGFSKNGKWNVDANGPLKLVYQTQEQNSAGKLYCGRSFEDAFIHLNQDFIVENLAIFESLKNVMYFQDASKGPYDLAQKCIGSKPSFAIEILLSSQQQAGKEYSNWLVPHYIKEGLEWLREY